MVEGPEECHDKTLTSTIVKPEEACDLQPSTHCRLVTNLVPHLESQTVCKDIPKEVCHLRLANPRFVKKPVTLRWCTKAKPTEKPSYLPPPAAPSYKPQPSYSPPAPSYSPPSSSYSTSSYSPQRNIEITEEEPLTPIYKPQKASPGSPIPTSSPVYYKPLTGDRISRRRY